MMRSVSTPVRNKPPVNLIPLPLPRNSIMFRDTASHPLLSPSTTSARLLRDPSTDDVFGIVKKTNARNGDGVNDVQDVGERPDRNQSKGLSSRKSYNEHIVGHHRLQLSDKSLGASLGAANYVSNDQTNAVPSSKPTADGKGPKDARFPATGLSAVSGGLSTLETASTLNDTDNQLRHSRSPRAPRPKSAIAEIAPARHHFRPSVEHGSLPPRGQGPKTPLPAVIDAQDTSSQGEQKSGIKILSRSNRAVPRTVKPLSFGQAIPLPPPSMVFDNLAMLSPRLPTSTEQSRSIEKNPSTTHEDSRASYGHNHLFKARTSSGSQPSAIASTISAFPIPPMHNPVGRLPMSISRTASLAESGASSAPVGDVYRAVAEANIHKLLERTRNHGAQLPSVNFNAIPPFERAWREVNEQLLVTIYGRVDVLLTDEDVQYLDCISREFKSGTYASDWVRDIFRPGREGS